MEDNSILVTDANATEGPYKPLDISKKEIRVLKILPGASSATLSPGQAPIECTIEHMFLDDELIYDALSYSWHDENLGTEFEEPEKPGSLISVDSFVYLDGCKVEIGKYLWTALWHLRQIAQGYVACPRSPELKLNGWEWITESNIGHLSLETPIWVDALCINQSDLKEKDLQFSLMGDIYKNAQYVHAWLGLPAENNGLAMKLMGELKNRLDVTVEGLEDFRGDLIAKGYQEDLPAAEAVSENYSATIYMERSPQKAASSPLTSPLRETRVRSAQIQKSDNCGLEEISDDNSGVEIKHEAPFLPQSELNPAKSTGVIKSLDEDENWRPHWLALFGIYDRPYWKRLWIVQDYLLGKKILMHIGICAIDGLIFSRIQNEIYQYCESRPFLQTVVVQNYLDLKRMDKLSSFIISRQKLEFNLQNSQVPLLDILTGYRQQLCSNPRDMVYGLLGLWNAPKQNVFRIDYSLSVAEVFKITARYIIESSASLDILLHAAERDNCICWAEKHRREKLSIPSWVPDWRCRGTMDLSWETTDHNASDGTTSNARFSPDNHILYCRGILLGKIEAGLDLSDKDPRWIESTRQRLLEFVSRVVENAGFSSDLDVGYVQHALRIIYQTLLYRLRPSLWGNISEVQFVEFFVTAFNSVEDALSMFPNRTVAEFTLKQCFRGAYFFSSRVISPVKADEGEILHPLEFGICYPNCKVGDAIAIIYGCRAPLVLRPDSNNPGRFKVLGHVYMPSFANGEAVGNFEQREFELS